MESRRIPEAVGLQHSGPSPREWSSIPGYLQGMEKSPEELSDDELIGRLREENTTVRPGYPVERDAPVDLENDGIELDQDGVRE